MSAYYNEFDPFAAEWLRNLIKAGEIAPGDVDERSILDVRADELAGYDQHHFFAGIGTWSYALRQAGWPDDRPVWTGSPPCQPFSVAGRQKGKQDERHLAPHWLNLVSEYRPANIFGEQVASAIRHDWLDDLQTHLEDEDYACGAIVLPACGVGSPHIRQRLWFFAERLANADSGESWRRNAVRKADGATRAAQEAHEAGRDGREDESRQRPIHEPAVCSASGGMADTIKPRRERRVSGRKDSERKSVDRHAGRDSAVDGLANAEHMRRDTRKPGNTRAEESPRCERRLVYDRCSGLGAACPTNGFWRNPDWLKCRDEKWRPVESGTFPLVDGATARVGRLRGYGNGIVAPLATEIIAAYMGG